MCYLGLGLCLMLGRDCLFLSTFSLVRAILSFSFSRSLSFFSFLFLSICMKKSVKKGTHISIVSRVLQRQHSIVMKTQNMTRFGSVVIIHKTQEERKSGQGTCFTLLATVQSNNSTVKPSVRFQWTVNPNAEKESAVINFMPFSPRFYSGKRLTYRSWWSLVLLYIWYIHTHITPKMEKKEVKLLLLYILSSPINESYTA